MAGRIHSIETLAAVDGPGVRMAVFFQGCPARCLYCHNPDMWDIRGGITMSAAEVLERAERMRPYFGREGGVTLTGGEPLMQAAFARELTDVCKQAGISVAIDTSGACWGPEAQAAVDAADLLLVDVKHTDAERHRELAGFPLADTLKLLDYTLTRKKPVWVRQVIVPGWTASREQVEALARLLKKYPNVQRVELLPYHTMARAKWEALNKIYPLAATREPTAEEMAELRSILAQAGLPVT